MAAWGKGQALVGDVGQEPVGQGAVGAGSG